MVWQVQSNGLKIISVVAGHFYEVVPFMKGGLQGGHAKTTILASFTKVVTCARSDAVLSERMHLSSDSLFV